MIALSVIVVASSYLLGSFPAGYVAGRLAKIDIRQEGSGNIGATNVNRVLGKRYGYPVFVLDFLKGFAAVFLARFLARNYAAPESVPFFQVIAAICCVLGHSFPIWLRFRGGKGVATSMGVLFAMMPLAALLVVITWLIIFQFTRYVSVASIAAALALPVSVAIVMHFRKTNDQLFLYFSGAIAAIIVLRHRSNLSRLLHGTEPRFRKSENQ